MDDDINRELDKPDYDFLRNIDPEQFKKDIRMLMADWIPFPSASYWEQYGCPMQEDGTVITPGGWRIPTRERCEVDRFEVKELEKMYELKDNRDEDLLR